MESKGHDNKGAIKVALITGICSIISSLFTGLVVNLVKESSFKTDNEAANQSIVEQLDALESQNELLRSEKSALQSGYDLLADEYSSLSVEHEQCPQSSGNPDGSDNSKAPQNDNDLVDDEVAQIIMNAENVFEDPATDYNKALDIIKAGMQKHPDNSELEKKYNYYLEFVPKSLFDFNAFEYGTYNLGIDKNETDNYGNVYDIAFHGFMSASEDQYSVYKIDKQYNLLKGVGFISESSSATKHSGGIQIFGDGVPLTEMEQFQAGDKPREITADITGITDLEIVMYGNGNGGTSGMHLYFGDVTLQKTMK